MSMSGASGSKRAILPRSTTAGPKSGLLPDSSTSPSLGRVGQGTSSRTNIRSACLACRRRRNRCSGGHPCNRCRSLETDCVYNESQDGRTLALRERGKQELETHKRVVHGLFKAVREGCEQRYLDLIRNNASIDVVAAALDEANVDGIDGYQPQTPDDLYLSTQSQLDYNIDYMQLDHQPELNFDEATDPQLLVQFFNAPTPDGDNTMSVPGSVAQDQLQGYSESMLDPRYMSQLPRSRSISGMQQLSALYLNARFTVRQIVNTGVPVASVLGGKGVVCSQLFELPQEPFNITTWATLVVNSVAGVDILFRLAWLCYVTRFLRWSLNPCEQNLRLMPVAMLPTPLQLEVAHPAVIDLIPLPQIRDTMIRNFRDFTGSLELAGATVHWTDPIDSAIDYDASTGNKYASQLFEQHIENTDNFCFGKSLLTTFPELEGQIQVSEIDHIVSISSTVSGTTPLHGGTDL